MLAQGIPAEEKEPDSKQQEKASEVIAFKQMNRAERIPETQQHDDEGGAQREFEEHARPREGVAGLCCFFCFFCAVALLSGEFSKERTCQKEQADEARECAIDLAQRRHSGRAGELQRFGGPVLDGADSGAIEEQARVRSSGNYNELRRSVVA